MPSPSAPCSALSLSDQLNLVDKLEVFKIQGRDKLGRKVLRIIGKFFPGKHVFNFFVLLFFLKSPRSLLLIDFFFFSFWRSTARLVSREALNKYLEDRVFPNLNEKPFSVVYVHTDVQRSENFPGISTLRSICEAIPGEVKENLEAVYFVHPGLQARLFLATFGRFIFSGR